METWLIDLLVWSLPILTATTWHEMAHAYVAAKRGDNTAKDSKRFTWNPIYHLDGFGTIVLPILLILLDGTFVFAWARPVPLNPHVLKTPWLDRPLVAISGSLANFAMVLAWIALNQLALWLGDEQLYQLGKILGRISNCGIQINAMLMLINLIPIPPLDAGELIKCFLKKRGRYYLSKLEPITLFVTTALLIYGKSQHDLLPLYKDFIAQLHHIYFAMMAFLERKAQLLANKLWR